MTYYEDEIRRAFYQDLLYPEEKEEIIRAAEAALIALSKERIRDKQRIKELEDAE